MHAVSKHLRGTFDVDVLSFKLLGGAVATDFHKEDVFSADVLHCAGIGGWT